MKKRELFSERERKGYVEIKVEEPNVWKQKQVYLYEKEKGVTVQKGKEVVIFLDGNNRNFDIDNLYLLERRYLGQLNGLRTEKDTKETVLEKIDLLKVKGKMLDLAEKVNLASCVHVGKYTFRRLKSQVNYNARKWARENPVSREEIARRFREKKRKELEALKISDYAEWQRQIEARRSYARERYRIRMEKLKADPIAYATMKARKREYDHNARIRNGRSVKYEE